MRAKTVVMAFLSCLFVTTCTLSAIAEEEERLELKPALLVIDVQNIWMPRMCEEDRSAAPQKINELIAMFREFGHPVIRVYHSDPKRGPAPDTEPFEFPDSIAVTNQDPQVIKSEPSAFTKTDLERILRESGRNTVFLCGLSATGCVLATYFGAQEREFIPVMVKGALLSHKASYTKTVGDICSSVTLEEARETLKEPYLERTP